MAPSDKKKLKVSHGDGDEEHPAVTLFREYLRIKTVHPNPDYESCNAFLIKQAKRLELPYTIKECVPGKPILVMTWKGTKPELPSLLLNSHTDVVPVFPDSWKHDPFAAYKDENGDIYGRGTQDMKSVGIQHLEAIKRLKDEGKSYERTIHLSFVADEEVGGLDGVKKWVHTPEFKALNVGFALDEGLADAGNVLPVYFGERNYFWIRIKCPGNPGHGSRFIENTAAEKAKNIIDKFLAYRDEQKKKLEADPSLKLGDVTTVNLTMMSGGVQLNVIPEEFELGFDIRIAPTENLNQFEDMIRTWMKESGEGLELEFAAKHMDQSTTSVNEEDKWFKAFKSAVVDTHGLEISPQIFPAGTDSRYLREVGIPALGFSPMNNTPVLLHDHNELLNEKVFIKGIDVFRDIIHNLASVQ